MPTIKALFAKTPLDKTDAKVLMAHVCQTTLGWPKTALISRDTDELEQSTVDLWLELEAKRLAGEPVAYLIGHREFHEIDLEVGPGVLIPRPETELLVDIGLNEIQQLHLSSPLEIQVLDLGTGSGAIALALANAAAKLHLPNVGVLAIDESMAALRIAEKNCARLNLGSIVRFQQSNWYEQLKPCLFDLILSNPPYIPLGDPHLSQGDLRFEPQSALTDHKDGLEAYRVILSNAAKFLKPNGFVAVEHGFDQGTDLKKLFLENGFSNIQTTQDISGQDRVTQGRLTEFT